ncbi:glucokinase [Viridothelium virens]|uniref:Gluconokinase n=1 Tax=Viridothelium virens TaxID=1048519 RepID=A0A6A6GUF8_VIRVR|nr:glucokinase [Viridothelium virens]
MASVNGDERLASSTKPQYIWAVFGPAGCGKSTIGRHLADQLALPYIEGDEFHPPSNIEKMAAGIPLTDADRWDWLILLREQSLAALDPTRPNTTITSDPAPSKPKPGVVLTCSALKRKYRDVIRIAAYHHPHIRVRFVYLKADEELILGRVRARQGHFMKETMVKSQFGILEGPAVEEEDVLSVDVAGTTEEVQAKAVEAVEREFGKLARTMG